MERTILLTGATGYVGGRLLRHLDADRRLRVRCLTRRPEVLAARPALDAELVRGDALDPASLARAMHGVDTAYYLIHSMGTRDDFKTLDRAAAKNFAAAARHAGLRQVIYLGGLGEGRDLSSHLASRQEVGDILRASGVPTIEFRASIVIGSGSASYETVRALVETLPVMVAPQWVDTAAQPIAIEDVIDYLLAALEYEGSAVFEIGGRDRVSYGEIIREYARQRGLRRRLIATPLLSPTASRFLIGLLTPVHGRVAGTMVDSLRNETVVTAPGALDTFGIAPHGLRDAIACALVNEDREFGETRWSDVLASGRPVGWAGLTFGRRLVSSRVVHVRRPPSHAFDPIRRIGGRTGWYATGWFWKARGLLDTLRGGAGLRRGRRDQVDLQVGDAVDFWRVEHVERDRLLCMAAEMKIPGRLWLQFEVQGDEGGGTHIRQTTVFDPAGVGGLAYWYLFSPIHHFVFSRMLRGIAAAVSPPPGVSEMN
ncbi:MAG TPA: SDR family oxidoreductase [Solirubrobacteraceae bacterium]|nr:SDR family oxidoreductase [Solirubrobacteraceae bacterium]